ncbi:MAG: hypothetical protein JWM63_814 [Gammaproteobacteria bacterium]|nr:hypothetical protein [Gammaproteobacteria bacterium]
MTGLIAQPWWVNLLVLVPPVAYFSWRRNRVPLTLRQLIGSGVFAAAFGFLEAVVVVYFRAAAGLLPGYQGTLSDVIRLSGDFYQQSPGITQFPQSLLTLEVFRETATILMLLSVAFLSSVQSSVRAAVFLWAFAIWDVTYYAALWATVRWPLSLKDPDVLFLIPVPWFSPVWFPLLVSCLAVAAVLLTRATPAKPQ